MTASGGHEITAVLERMASGEERAREELWGLVYDELRRIARSQMSRERPGQTLEPTALVHEAYLRLMRGADPGWENRAHFFSVAAEAMRRILIDRARRRLAQRRGGGARRVEIDLVEIGAPTSPEQYLELDEALTRLEGRDPQRAHVVKLRFFAGLTEDEAASALGVSPRTARRLWSGARAWLHRELARSGQAAPG